MFKVRIGPINERQTQALDSGLVNSYSCSPLLLLRPRIRIILALKQNLKWPSHPLNARERGSEILGQPMHGPLGCGDGERGLVRAETELLEVKYYETKKKHSLLPNPAFQIKFLQHQANACFRTSERVNSSSLLCPGAPSSGRPAVTVLSFFSSDWLLWLVGSLRSHGLPLAAQMVKCLLSAGDPVLILGTRGSPGEGDSNTHTSVFLHGEVHGIEKPGRL